ncbi:MAG: YggT family protein [Gordonia sp. (in: high G+C Gram-positive bacteria)]
MEMVFEVLYYILFVYWLLLLARLVVELVRTFAREWRPTGIVVIVIEVIFTATDPPIKLLRRLLPPISLGPVRLDLSLMIVMIVVIILMQVVGSFRPVSAAMGLGL